jgi:hypothetical protein
MNQHLVWKEIKAKHGGETGLTSDGAVVVYRTPPKDARRETLKTSMSRCQLPDL